MAGKNQGKLGIGLPDPDPDLSKNWDLDLDPTRPDFCQDIIPLEISRPYLVHIVNLKNFSIFFINKKFEEDGSGGGSVGRAVDSDSRSSRFVSSQQQKFLLNIYCQLFWKDENKEKVAGNCPFLKKKVWKGRKK